MATFFNVSNATGTFINVDHVVSVDVIESGATFTVSWKMINGSLVEADFDNGAQADAEIDRFISYARGDHEHN